MERTKKPPADDDAKYREACIDILGLRRVNSRTHKVIHRGIANIHGNDFAIYLSNMVEKQKYFQKHFPRYQGDFFLVEQAQMEETNLKHHTLQKCKVKAVDELKIFTTKLRSRVVKGIKSTKEWYTIKWRVLYDVLQNSAYTKTYRHSKGSIETQSAYPKTDRHMSRSSSQAENGVTNSLPNSSNRSDGSECLPENRGVISVTNNTSQWGTDVPPETKGKKRHQKSTRPYIDYDGIRYILCSDGYYRDACGNPYID